VKEKKEEAKLFEDKEGKKRCSCRGKRWFYYVRWPMTFFGFHQLLTRKKDFDLIQKSLVALICENLFCIYLQTQDMFISGNTVTIWRICMIMKSIPLAFYTFSTLLVGSIYPVVNFRKELLAKIEAEDFNKV